MIGLWFREGRPLTTGVLMLILCVAPMELSAQKNPFKWFGGDKDVKYQTYKDPGGRFEMEYPTKDWRILTSPGSTLAVFSHKDGPSLFVDRTQLTASLTPDEFNAMPDIELDRRPRQGPGRALPGRREAVHLSRSE